MRKNFLLIATLCICGTFASANTHRFAANNAAQNASPFNTSFVDDTTDDNNELNDLKKQFEEDIRNLFDFIPEEYKTLDDQRKIDKYISRIQDAQNKEKLEEAYEGAFEFIDAIKQRKNIISRIEKFEKETQTPQGAADIVICLKERIKISDNVGDMNHNYMIAVAIILANKYQIDAIANIREAMGKTKVTSYLYNIVSREIEGILNAGEDTSEISDRVRYALYDLKLVVPHYMAGMSAALGTLGTPQNGPAIEVTDQNNVVIKLYNPKSAKLIEVK